MPTALLSAAVLAAALLFLPGGPAMAAPLSVRSGEHPGFSRIVVPTGERGDWRIGRIGAGYGVDLGQPGPDIDLSRAFDRIGRQRIADLRYDAATGRLTVALACACFARSFTTAGTPGALVIDILDGAAPDGAPSELPLDAGITPRAMAPAPLAVTYRSPVARDGYLPAYWPDPRAEPAAGPAAGDTVAPAPPDLQRRDAMVAALSAELARAAAQGLVDPALRPAIGAAEIARGAAPTPPSMPPPVSAGLADLSPPAPGSVQAIGMAAQTAVDRDNPAEAAGPAMDGTGTCLSDDRLRLQSWGGEGPPANALARLNRALLGEFDRPDPQVAQDLVRLYLFLGWGAEARAALAAFVPEAADATLWQALADLLDGRPDAAGIFAAMQDCPGDAALWGVLSAGAGGADTGAVRRAFGRLPPHLRRDLGPRLAGLFLDAGDGETALSLRNATERPNGGVAEPSLSGAELARQGGDAATATATLRAIVTANTADAPEALIRLAEVALAAGETVAAGDIVLMGAMARERAGTGLGTRLTALQARATAAGGEVAAAIALWSALPPEAGAEIARPVAQAVASALAGAGDDAAFAMLLGQTADRVATAGVAPDTLATLAARAARLGLSGAARRLEQGLAGGPGAADAAQLARAGIAAAGGEDARVLSLLAGRDDPEAAALRAAALEGQERWSDAADAWGSAGQADRADAALWRAGRWSDLATPAAAGGALSPAMVTAALLVPEPSPPAGGVAPDAAPDPEGDPGDLSLARATAQLAESAQARAAIAELLQATALEPAPAAP